jgi:hypothetical protein
MLHPGWDTLYIRKCRKIFHREKHFAVNSHPDRCRKFQWGMEMHGISLENVDRGWPISNSWFFDISAVLISTPTLSVRWNPVHASRMSLCNIQILNVNWSTIHNKLTFNRLLIESPQALSSGPERVNPGSRARYRRGAKGYCLSVSGKIYISWVTAKCQNLLVKCVAWISVI